MILMVTYDLHNPKRDYGPLIAELQKATWAHPQDSMWFLDTLQGVVEWRDRLKAKVDANDEIFVARMKSHDWASFNMDKEIGEWLNHPSRRW